MQYTVVAIKDNKNHDLKYNCNKIPHDIKTNNNEKNLIKF